MPGLPLDGNGVLSVQSSRRSSERQHQAEESRVFSPRLVGSNDLATDLTPAF
jgi:hypothetical protein